jgi:hypothetical protein
MVLALAGVARAGYTPIAIQSSSYTADIVVESNATPSLEIVTSASVDNGTNNTANTWFEIGYDLANPGNGLPAHGTTFTASSASDHSFTMAPDYTKPNGILIDTVVTTGTFTPVTPAAYTKLSFLGSGGNGGDVINVTVNHADGTSETGFSFGCPDWFNGTLNVAYIAGGRCNSTVNLTTETDGQNPRIYFRDITLTDTASPVTNIVLSYGSGGSGSHNDILAVSGALTSGTGAVTPITVTGYDYDFIVESNAAHGGRVMSQTMLGGTNVWATTQTLDNEGNTGNAWYEQGYNVNNSDAGNFNNPLANLTGTGIPPAGSLLTNAAADHIYQMPSDYTTNDAIYISDNDAYTNATITLTTPTAFSGLSFLGSAGNGPVPVNYLITHQGGTTESGVLVINDWFNGSVPQALIANGRVAVDTAQFGNVNSGDPILLVNDIVLTDTTDPVISIYLENTNGVDQGLSSGRFGILALSGSAGALPPLFTLAPQSTNNYAGTSVAFTGAATANAPITYQWQKGTNGVFVNLANGGNISGVTTTTLSINPIGFGDAADYRVVATDVAGSAPSAVGTLGVFSSATDVTEPGDPISVGSNVSPFGDGSPTYAIDDSMDTKFGANYNSGTVPYMVVAPSAGRTVLSGIRIYTGSDTTSRDPASFEIEGSLNGGSTYTLISSNAIKLSDNRNPLTSGEAPNPLTQWCTEVDFANATAYTSYRVSFPTQKGSGQIQFDEMELLGTIDTSKPTFNPQPTDTVAYAGPTTSPYGSDSASFTATAVFTPTPTVSWLRGTNGLYIALSDGGNISGSQSTTLNINPTTFADSADYVAVANSTAGFVTSSIAHLYIYSTNLDVTQPGDVTISFGDNSGTEHGANADAGEAIDDSFTEWQNGGSGINAAANFPPFGGPVGFTNTPAVGSTVLSGLRIYPGQDASANDPSSYILEGSNDGGITYLTLSSGPLALPGTRNPTSSAVDPAYFNPLTLTYVSVQEILFSNTRGFTSYRLTFPNVVSPSSASYLEVGEVELLGVPGLGVAQPVIGHAVISAGNLSISGTGGTPLGGFTVQTNANLSGSTGWNTAMTGTYDSSGNFSISLPVSSANSKLFYRIQQ